MNKKTYIQQTVKKVKQVIVWVTGLFLREAIREYVIPHVKEIIWSLFDE
ncbi:hypothetical protein [Proteus mirabilis]|nr:hypothetical protein [Proteus mirabilis]MCS6741710.1 hypothetical protein [Acinetobacter baumannii]MBG5998021.1 hypothetical protein [Proteus mirabilis]MCS6718676.1 hypothetical protein [Proteus mirabilis]MCS6723179.1 hypothetical protein [Proteus mirabilis]MCS6730170.1 hypothetical protein [Proteus mirabilis]